MRMSIYDLGSSGEEDEEYHSDGGYYTDSDGESHHTNPNPHYPYYDTSVDMDALMNDFVRLHIYDVDETLTVEKMDFLAAGLGISWKRFARMTRLFDEADLYHIDEGHHFLYEKSYQMIQLWQAKSRDILTISMVTSILMVIDRNALARDLRRFDAPVGLNSLLSHEKVDRLCRNISSSWRKVARETGLFSYVEIQNINEEERNLYEKCYRLIIEWQEKSIVMLSLNEIESKVAKTYKGGAELIQYTIDNSNDVHKVEVKAHQGLKGINQQLSSITNNTARCKVQYVDFDGNRVTCGTESQLDLAIFSEGVRKFDVLTEESRP